MEQGGSSLILQQGQSQVRSSIVSLVLTLNFRAWSRGWLRNQAFQFRWSSLVWGGRVRSMSRGLFLGVVRLQLRQFINFIVILVYFHLWPACPPNISFLVFTRPFMMMKSNNFVQRKKLKIISQINHFFTNKNSTHFLVFKKKFGVGIRNFSFQFFYVNFLGLFFIFLSTHWQIFKKLLTDFSKAKYDKKNFYSIFLYNLQ